MQRPSCSLLFAFVLATAACGSDPASPADGGVTPHADASASGTDATAGGEDATAQNEDASIPAGPHPTPGVCVPDPEGTGNSKNVGAYCTKGGSQCSAYTFAKFCSIDLDQEGNNFCIHIGCSDHDSCGEEACCTGRAGNPIHACIPKGCVAPDAGSACPPIP